MPYFEFLRDDPLGRLPSVKKYWEINQDGKNVIIRNGTIGEYMAIENLKHISEYDDPYCDEVWEIWSHPDFCFCEACRIFHGGERDDLIGIKEFENAEDAESEVVKLIKLKIRKGYIEKPNPLRSETQQEQKRKISVMTTEYAKQIEILNELWIERVPELEELFDMFDVGFPLAHCIFEGIVESTPLAQESIEQAFKALLRLAGVEDTGFKSSQSIVDLILKP
jgi:predicted DNA-binding WGR domain protein